MLVIRILKSSFFTFLLILLFHDAYCDEIYYIDNSPLFLYKTINWWYDCLPKESKKLCGKPIKCSNTGNTQVEYDEPNKKMEIKIKGGFATMLLALKRCKQCYGPSYFRCILLEREYFDDTDANVILSDSSTIIGFSFGKIKKEQAQHIQSIAYDLQFIIEGVIGGLSNGQIALHESCDLLNKCNKASPDLHNKYPITLSIIKTSTNEKIAPFDMFWER